MKKFDQIDFVGTDAVFHPKNNYYVTVINIGDAAIKPAIQALNNHGKADQCTHYIELPSRVDKLDNNEEVIVLGRTYGTIGYPVPIIK